ncbi:VWA domain-containing protein [candidate division KSB1 bacterium]|nr:VWA domain-containing protein [candidate division KSB1 bacterium]
MKSSIIYSVRLGIMGILLMSLLIGCGTKSKKAESIDQIPESEPSEAPFQEQRMARLLESPEMRLSPNLRSSAPRPTARALKIGASVPAQPGQTDETPTEFNTESYDRIVENPFLEATKNPLSTFSIDVDVASYANVRRFINNSQLPPPDAVRIEELINYFSYDYPSPQGPHPFSITTEISDCPWSSAHRLLLIGLQGQKLQLEALPPNNLVFLLDVSGSMDEPNKLPLLKASLRLLVNQLRPQDRVAIVVYAGAAGLVLPATSGDKKPEILAALEQLQAGGSTAGGAGIQLAYEVAKEHFLKNGNNRVILATDGDFNVGASSDAEMERLIEEKRRLGIYLTVLGFGMGNYKDSKMEKLADTGNGNYAYIDDILEAKKVLVSQLGGTLLTLAKDVKIQIEFNPAKIKAYRLIGYENRLLRAEDFHDDRKDAGELGAGHSVTALYELIPANAKTALPRVDDLKYQKTTVNPEAAKSPEMLTVKFRYKAPADTVSQLIEQPVLEQVVKITEASTNLRFAAAVAGFGMLLRQSAHRGDATFEKVQELAKAALGPDVEGYRHEFLRLVEKSQLLKAGK